MKYYYANAANQPAGPVTLDELQQLLARGEITPATNIIPVGETVWRPLSTLLPAGSATTTTTASSTVSPSTVPTPPIPTTAAPAFKPADVAKLPTILATFIGVLINKARALLSIPRLTALFASANSIGQILVLAGAAFALIYGVIHAIKYDSFEIFLYGLAAVFVLAVLQFIARRLLDACASILKTSPTRVASVAVLECFALLLLLSGIGALASGIIAAIQLENAAVLLPALVIFLVCTASAGVALHPSLANVEEAPSTAGEEAIGLFSFFAKSGLVLQPLLFALYAAVGAVAILLAIFGQDTAFAATLLTFVPFDLFDRSGPGGPIGVIIIATACLFPLTAYLSFLAYYLLIDVLRAILSIPQKLDQLRR
jgi:hypothetical protein